MAVPVWMQDEKVKKTKTAKKLPAWMKEETRAETKAASIPVVPAADESDKVVLPKSVVNALDMFARDIESKKKTDSKPDTTLLKLSKNMNGAVKAAAKLKSKDPSKTPVDSSRYNVVGQNLIPTYEEDTGLAKLGKDAVNYGVGTASRVAEAVPQAAMKVVSNIGNAIQGKPQDWSDKTLRKDILPPAYGNALKKLATKGIGGEIAAQGIDMLINMGLDPTTYVMGGVIDDLAKAGITGKASKPSTEFVKLAGERQFAMVAKQTGKTAVGAIDTVGGANKAELQNNFITPKKIEEPGMLTEAKQPLMLEAPKLRTPDVIEGMPIKPKSTEIKKLKTPVKNLPKEKAIIEKKPDFTVDQYGNVLKSSQKSPLLLDAPEVMQSLSEKAKQIERPFGVTKNEAKKMNLPKNITKQSELIPEKPVIKNQADWVKSLRKIDTADLAEKKALKEKLRQYEEATRNTSYNVPEQYRKETPFTVSKSTTPNKVESKYAKERVTGITTQPTQPVKTLKTAKDMEIPAAKTTAENGVQKLKTSKFRTNTIERSTMIPDDIKKKLKPEDYDFVPETSPEWKDKAIKNIETDRAAVIKSIKETDSISGGTQAHEAAIITEELVAKAEKGDTDELLEWLPTVTEKTRETARGLKGTDTAWDKGPASTLVKAQRMLDNSVPDDISKAIKTETKAAKSVLNEINKVNANNVDDVFKDFLSEKPKVTKALREYLDKQEAAATQRVKDFFKPDTSGIIKMRSGPPGEILTDLATIGAAKLARRTLDFAEWSAEMLKEFGEKIKPYLEQVYSDSQKLIKSKSLKASASSIDKAIRQIMSENGVKIQEIAGKHVSEIDATGQTLAQKFVNQLGLSEDAAEKVEKVFIQRMKEMTTTKKQQILDQMLKTKKTYQRKSLSDKVIELSNMGAIGEEKYAKILKEKYNIPELSADDVQRIIKQSEEIQGMTDVFKRQAATNKMMSDIQKKIPSSFAAKLKSYTMINTLLNTKTTIARNVPGNIAQMISMRMDKYVASAIDFTRSKLTGTERRVTFKTGRGIDNVFKEFMEDTGIGAKSGYQGYNPYGTISEFKMATQAFQSKYNPLTYLEKTLGALLGGAGDYPFYMKAVKDTIGEQAYLKAMNQGLKGDALKTAVKKYADEIINSAKDMSDYAKDVLFKANRSGEKATFRDDNIVSAVLQGVKDVGNIAGFGNVTTKSIKLGKKNFIFSSNEVGLGDAIVMFAKTPGSLVNIAVEHSPLGILKSLYYITDGVYKTVKGTGGLNTEKLAESIRKAVGGTLVLTGAGWYLASKGALKGKAPSDKEAREFFDENGEKEYSFNLDAIARWAKGGFKNEDLQPKNGDRWYTYDWMMPFSLNVGLGANIAQEGVKLNNLQAIPDTLGASMKMFSESDAMSNLFGSSYQTFEEKAIRTLQSLPSRFVPLGSIVNQVRQMSDNTKRDTSSDDPWIKTINLLKNRIPGLSKELPAVLTTTGEVKEMYAGGSNNPLNVLLSPGYLGIYKTSPGRELLKNLYKSTGKTSQFPKLQTNKIKIYGTEYPLSNDQKADLQKYVGQMTWTTLDNLVTAKSTKRKEFADFDDEVKLKVISNLMEEIGNKAELYMADKLKIKKPTKQEEKDKKVEIPKFKMAK